MTHWSTRTLAKAAVCQGIVPHIAHSTVSLILRAADLQPHRARYWKTPHLDEDFVERTCKILWCYERVDQLCEHDEVVVCLDEKPQLQALERRQPKRAMRAGRIERQEFEYLRHGTVNFLGALFVPDGTMRGWCLECNDSAPLIPTLDELFEELRAMRRIHLIWDGGPSHTSGLTAQCLHRHRQKVRVLLTPAHASWLNQAELLLRAFSERYLKRGDWTSRIDLADHLQAAWREYNDLLAHPFHWSWTRRKMRDWVNNQVH